MVSNCRARGLRGGHAKETYVSGWRFIKGTGCQGIHADRISFTERSTAVMTPGPAVDSYRRGAEFGTIGVNRALRFELCLESCYFSEERLS